MYGRRLRKIENPPILNTVWYILYSDGRREEQIGAYLLKLSLYSPLYYIRHANYI